MSHNKNHTAFIHNSNLPEAPGRKPSVFVRATQLPPSEPELSPPVLIAGDKLMAILLGLFPEFPPRGEELKFLFLLSELPFDPAELLELRRLG